MNGISNQHKDWESVYKDLLNKTTLTTDDREINVTLGPVDDETGEITNLRYFLPLAVALAERGKISETKPLVLSINMTDEIPRYADGGADQGDYDNIWRLKAFFPICASMPYVQIKINGLKQAQLPWSASRIFPVCCVSEREEDPFPSYLALRKNYYSKQDERNVSGQDNDGEPFVSYANTLLAYINDPSNYIGTTTGNMNREDIRDNVMKELHTWLPTMDLLSQMIWTYMLRILIILKELFSFVPDQPARVREHILIKSRMDAAFYAESIYQLSENACIHSRDKRAYFGLRMHYTNRMAGINDFVRAAKTRARLANKYVDCVGKGEKSIFSEDYRFYMEFYVLNLADEQDGITPTYNRQTDEYNLMLDKEYLERNKKNLITQLRKELEPSVRESFAQELEKDISLQNLNDTAREKKIEERLDAMMTEERLIDFAGKQLTKLEEAKKEAGLIEKDYYLHRKHIDHLYTFFNEQKSRASLVENKDVPFHPLHERDDEYSKLVHERNIEDIVIHYGLRLLGRIITANKGYLIGWSPNGEAAQYYHIGEEGRDYSSSSIYTTELCAIIPVSGVLPKPDQISVSEADIYGEKVIPYREQIVYLNCNDVCGGASGYVRVSEHEMFLNIHRAFDLLKKRLAGNWEQFEKTVFQIDLTTDDTVRLEQFSKYLFGLISHIHYMQASIKQLCSPRIAILFSNPSQMGEFVRLFSIFFTLWHDYLNDVQIALCTSRENDPDTYAVNLIFNGSNLAHIRESARLFAYYDSKEVLTFLPLLPYIEQLNRALTEEPPLAPVFPFDLYLRQHSSSTGMGAAEIVPWKDSWFIDRTKQVLNTDIQSPELGCAIRDIQLRLGSKLHFDCFYEAELLFQNKGITMRFAYLMAQELLFGVNSLRDGSRILLIGYEDYSATLLLQVEKWLYRSGRFKDVRTVIVNNDTKKESVIHVTPFYSNKGGTKYLPTRDTCFVTILPIGTTLSTIYKMHNAVTKECGFLQTDSEAVVDGSDNAANTIQPILNEDMFNFCLILINHDLISGNLSEVSQRFWKNASPETGLVQIRPEFAGGPALTVRYLIAADAEWHAPEKCEICGNSGESIRPVIDVKQSEMVPTSIFPLQAERKLFDTFFTEYKRAHSPKKNDDRIKQLVGYIRYSHICEENNHFQFFIDFKSFYQRYHDDIEEAVRKWKTELDPGDMHVVVSPLQLENSQFSQTIISSQFGNAVSYLHFDLTDTYREEARAKFSNIMDDFQQMKRANAKAKLNVYFVDTSIVSASRLSRAQTLIRMLGVQAGIRDEDLVIFRRIFLLVNRCSFDTINSFVSDPVQNLRAYIYLDIPSYNTENDKCPACRLVEKYSLLQKRSSTRSLSEEFLRLGKKHKKRTREEDEKEVRREILTSPSYLSRLVQWLNYNVPEEGGDTVIRTIAPFTDFHDADKRLVGILSKWINNPNLRGKSLNEALELTMKNLLPKTNFDIFRDEIIDLIQRHILQTHDYVRFYAMERAYEELDKNAAKEPLSAEILYNNTRIIIMNLLNSTLKDIPKRVPGKPSKRVNTEEERYNVVYNLEWIIAYVKVISREQLSNYYYVRQAIMGVMSDMLKLIVILIERSGEETDRTEETRQKKRTEKSKSKGDAPAYSNPRFNLPNDLVNEHVGWNKIVRTLERCLVEKETSRNTELYAALAYELYMTLTHRMADLHSYELVREENICDFVNVYIAIWKRSLSEKAGNSLCLLPERDAALRRYLKAIKSATMTSNDDTPCLSLAKLPRSVPLRGKKAPTVVENPWDSLATSMIKSIFTQIYIENTRILFSGMLELEKGIDRFCFAKEGGTHFPERLDKLDQYVRGQLKRCYESEEKPDNILYQSPLGNLCRYWHSSEKTSPFEESAPNGKLSLTYLFHYFRLMDWLDDRVESNEKSEPERRRDLLPYVYEEVCRTICGFTQAEMCYIACRIRDSSPEIFTQSGYQSELMSQGQILNDNDIGTISRIIDINSCSQELQNNPDVLDEQNRKKPEEKAEKRWREEKLISGVTLLIPCESADSKCRDFEFLVFDIPILGDDEKDSFYIILQLKKQNEADRMQKAIRKTRDVLFLRQRLQTALSQDYTILSNYRFDSSYIIPICDRENIGPTILHLSDLHITTELEDVEPAPFDSIMDMLKVQVEPRQVDLLAITGDIVDGRSANASQMEDNYLYAQRLLDRIVIYLWEDSQHYLPHDWKRRVIISTGNHDYAAMNQLKAQLTRRTLSVGIPMDTESGTMAKFAYFIEFLTRYLDPPIQKLLHDDLNEIRNYRYLNLKLLILNCSSRATAKRTNKMGVDTRLVADLLERNGWSDPHDFEKQRPFYLCMAHYAPGNELSYLLDNYHILPGWNWETHNARTLDEYTAMNYFVACFVDAASGELTYEEAIQDEVSLDTEIKRVDNQLKQESDVEEIKTLNKRLDSLNAQLAFVQEHITAQKKRQAQFVEAFDALEIARNDLKRTRDNPLENASTACADYYYRRLKSRVKADEKYAERITELLTELKNNDLFLQIKQYYDWLKKKRPGSDEHVSSLIHEVTECKKMSNDDKESFEGVICSCKQLDCFLAGHIHAYMEKTWQIEKEKEVKVLVADKMFTVPLKGINGFLLTDCRIDTDGKNHVMHSRLYK